MENSAVLAPIARASVRTATAVKDGDFASMRRANLRSCIIAFIISPREAAIFSCERRAVREPPYARLAARTSTRWRTQPAEDSQVRCQCEGELKKLDSM